MKKYLAQALTSISSLVVLLVYFQNCANDTSPWILESETSSTEVTEPLPLEHPPEKTIVQTTVKYQLANRDYVINLMKDIFSDANGVPINELEGILDKWVLTRSGQFGLGCDTTSSYTGQDCPSQVDSSNLPVYSDDNTIRESYIVQLCQSVLSVDSAVVFVKQKVQSGSEYPNRDAVIKIYNLFYRSNDPNDNTINTLLDLDRALAANREDQMNRWRGVILQVCESPGWQMF